MKIVWKTLCKGGGGALYRFISLFLQSPRRVISIFITRGVGRRSIDLDVSQGRLDLLIFLSQFGRFGNCITRLHTRALSCGVRGGEVERGEIKTPGLAEQMNNTKGFKDKDFKKIKIAHTTHSLDPPPPRTSAPVTPESPTTPNIKVLYVYSDRGKS